jgi:hypothetical protein
MHAWHDVELGDHVEDENKTVDVQHLRGRVEAEHVVRDAVRLYRERILPARGRPTPH